MKLAVVGTGIAGLTVAHYARQAGHSVTCFERSHKPGGHVNTLDLTVGGEAVAVDTGFIVFNRRNYPLFSRLLDELDISSIATRMSFACHDRNSGRFYAGNGIGGLFADPQAWRDPAHWRMLSAIARFNRDARTELAAGANPNTTVGAFLTQRHYPAVFAERYLWPMCAAIWSAPRATIAQFPLRWFLQFFSNHGMFCGRDAPAWRTIPGGARRYVRAITEPFGADCRTNCAVRAIERPASGGVVIHHDHGHEHADRVVLACHAPQALRLLADPSPAEQRVLGALTTQPNTAVVHSDASVMPPARRAWACWNYHAEADAIGDADPAVSVTYHMNQLQRLRLSQPLLVTLGPVAERIDPALVHRRIDYHHPCFDVDAVAAQGQRAAVSGVDRVHFAGAWWGFGFHEDGCRSGHAVLAELGIDASGRVVA